MVPFHHIFSEILIFKEKCDFFFESEEVLDYFHEFTKDNQHSSKGDEQNCSFQLHLHLISDKVVVAAAVVVVANTAGRFFILLSHTTTTVVVPEKKC